MIIALIIIIFDIIKLNLTIFTTYSSIGFGAANTDSFNFNG
jgi:hypothetical protein